jgi:UPF0755 protein
MNKTIIAFLILVLILLIWWQPINFGNAEITIPKGVNAREIAEYLSTRHIVRDTHEFLFWLKISGKEKFLKPGTYTLQKYKNPIYLINRLTRGGKLDILVTIPEGLTVFETAEILAEKGIVVKEEFIKYCTDKAFIEKLGLTVSSLEGYLFPDTYAFSTSQSDSVIIQTFIKNLKSHVKKYNIEDLNSIRNILIIASMIEKEAKYEDERPIIARVFLNRLSTRRPLESCATVLYVLKARSYSENQSSKMCKTKLTERDLKIDSPYNTYIHLGLPPGPICSPGESSINSVISPADVNFLYFVSKGDGRHHFSETYKEHLAAKARYNVKN